MFLAFDASCRKDPDNAGPTDLHPFRIIEHVGKVREIEIRILLLKQPKHEMTHLRFDCVFRLSVSIAMDHSCVAQGGVLLFKPDDLPDTDAKLCRGF